jgi:hypothetical protein
MDGGVCAPGVGAHRRTLPATTKLFMCFPELHCCPAMGPPQESAVAVGPSQGWQCKLGCRVASNSLQLYLVLLCATSLSRVPHWF